MKTGSLLLAEPFLADPNFKRSAVAIVDHNDEGTVGFVLSHKLDWRVTDVVDGFPEFDAYMCYGGPVQRDTLHFVHQLGSSLPDSLPVRNGLWWGGDFERLTGLIADGIADPTNTRFFLGYSGWSPGQLREEMETNTWLVTDLTDRLLFGTPPSQVWAKAMRGLGNVYGVISEMDEEAMN